MKTLEELEKLLFSYQNRIEGCESEISKNDWQFVFTAIILLEILRELRK